MNQLDRKELALKETNHLITSILIEYKKPSVKKSRKFSPGKVVLRKAYFFSVLNKEFNLF